MGVRNARNWYLTSARELEGGKLDIQSDWFRGVASPAARVTQFSTVPAAELLGMLSTRVQAERTAGLDQSATIVLSDTGERLGLEIRHGIAETYPRAPEKTDLVLTTTKHALATLVAGEATLPDMLAARSAEVAGLPAAAIAFFGYFDPPLRDWSALRFTQH